jgi:hypothetical protein
MNNNGSHTQKLLRLLKSTSIDISYVGGNSFLIIFTSICCSQSQISIRYTLKNSQFTFCLGDSNCTLLDLKTHLSLSLSHSCAVLREMCKFFHILLEAKILNLKISTKVLLTSSYLNLMDDYKSLQTLSFFLSFLSLFDQ